MSSKPYLHVTSDVKIVCEKAKMNVELLYRPLHFPASDNMGTSMKLQLSALTSWLCMYGHEIARTAVGLV